MSSNITGAILAGGTGTRFGGRLKPRISIEGQEIISRLLAVVSDFFDEIIIVTGKPEEFTDYPDCQLIPDIFPGCGPLGGIHAALSAAPGKAVFVFAGDMPYPDRKLIEMMITEWEGSSCDALIPRAGNLSEPLHAIYASSLAGTLGKYLEEGKSKAVRDFVGLTDVKYFIVDDSEETRRAFTNINRESDLPGTPSIT
jgi:molybdenum cofactor guanylyltransferase